MSDAYQAWIREHYPTPESARVRCHTASSMMVKEFPELKQVRGWVNRCEHWWCKKSDGTIVDPTAHQFKWFTPEPNMYVEFRESVDPEPLGRCMFCGFYSWAKDRRGDQIPEASADCCGSPDCLEDKAALMDETNRVARGEAY